MPAVIDPWKAPSLQTPHHAVSFAHPDADSFNASTAQAYCEAVRALAWLSLRTVFGEYLAQSFSMARSEHLHLSNIVNDMTQRHVQEELYRVAEMAREMCERIAPCVGPQSGKNVVTG